MKSGSQTNSNMQKLKVDDDVHLYWLKPEILFGQIRSNKSRLFIEGEIWHLQ